MCFSEKQSYLHCIVLFITSFYIRDKWQLASSLFFLGLKDLIQGLSYHYINDKKIKYINIIFLDTYLFTTIFCKPNILLF